MGTHGGAPEAQASPGDCDYSSSSTPNATADSHLRGLAGAAEGFGSASIGGLHGEVYHVTSLADEGDGTLRDGCKKTEPLWIVFDVSGTINAATSIQVQSFNSRPSIGRGQRIKITNKGLQLKECENVIICNLEFQRGVGADADAIALKPNTRHVWIDRCTLSEYDDGLIDITRQSSFVTVSRCHFFNHDKTILIGADPKHLEDRSIRVTIHHCFYDGTNQRHPRVRFGKVHLYNNYTRGWTVYAVCASVESQILSQHCVYEAGDNSKGFEYYSETAGDSDHEASGALRSEGDLFLNGAQGRAQSPDQVFGVGEFYGNYTLERAGAELVRRIPQIAGWQDVSLPRELAADSLAVRERRGGLPNSRSDLRECDACGRVWVWTNAKACLPEIDTPYGFVFVPRLGGVADFPLSVVSKKSAEPCNRLRFDHLPSGSSGSSRSKKFSVPFSGSWCNSVFFGCRTDWAVHVAFMPIR